MRLWHLILLLFVFRLTAAQELPVAQQYMQNLSYINPACIGREYCTFFYGTDRHQWLGIPQAPATQVFGAEHTFFSNPYQASRKIGLALQFISDRNGSVHQTGGQAGYAYHVRLNKKKDLFLSLGLSASLLQHSIREGESNVTNDQALGAGENTLAPDVSTGVFVYSPKFYAGFSVLRMLPYSRQFYYWENQSFIPGNYYLHAGYTIMTRSKGIAFIPSAVFKFDNQMSKQIDFNLITHFSNRYKAGVSYRYALANIPGQSTAIQFLISTYYKSFQFNYIADLSLNSTQAHHYGSHEFGVIYRMCYREKPQCPAFE
jgi:type IX secretion system PorP/SprF family membrane protein